MSWENVERWLRGEVPRSILPDKHKEEFFQELDKRGFIKKGETMQVEGFSGPYYLSTFEDEAGNQVVVQSGGRMPTKVDFYVASQPSPSIKLEGPSREIETSS